MAALQYLTENELAALYPAVLAEGLTAVTRATDRLAGPEGVVETALREIQVLDELDAVEAPPGHEHFGDTLAQADLMQRTEWVAATQAWVCDMLQFARRGEGGPDSDVWRYQFRRPRPSGPSTLMPVDRVLRHFSHVIDTEDERSTPDTPLTHPLAFDRRRAQNQRVALARIGDPFIDALVEYVRWDDRGACAAMWRLRPKSRFARPAEVAYRFEFVVECPTAEAVAALPAARAWSREAIRRQADWLFPPFALTLWLGQDLEVVTDPSRLADLTAEYSKQRRPDGGRDFNLNADRWAAIEPHFPRSDWSRQVQRARQAAKGLLRSSEEWGARVEERSAAARRTFADRQAQATSRLAFLAGRHLAEERERTRVEGVVSAALLAGIEGPDVRLDSVAAVFLADWNPFTETDE